MRKAFLLVVIIPLFVSIAFADRPSNCFDTAYKAQPGYNGNEALWDSYMNDSSGVCQSEYGKGVPSPCKHSVQLSREGNPYYLCWYEGEVTQSFFGNVTSFFNSFIQGLINFFKSLFGVNNVKVVVYNVTLSNSSFGRPSNCDDTAYKAQQGYNGNDELWDSYMSDSDGVCQTRQGSGVPSGPCVHAIQVGTALEPAYLCWYKN